MPRIMKQAALNIPVVQYDETMVFPTVQKEQRTQDAKTQLFADVLVQQAQVKAARILENAKEEAEKLLRETRVQLSEEAENSRLEAEKTGYAQGFENGQTQGLEQGLARGKAEYDVKVEETCREMARQLQQVLDGVEQYRQGLKVSNRAVVIELVRRISHKILSLQLEENNELMVKLLENALHGQEPCRSVRIRCGNAVFAALSSCSAQVGRLLEKVSPKIVMEECVELQPDECVVECDDTAQDISLNVQLDNVTKILNCQLD